jgi:hypothetical protein
MSGHRKIVNDMKNVFIIVVGLLICSLTKGQRLPITNDTVVCILDTTKSYVKFKENPIRKENHPVPYHWQVEIEGSYYNGKSYEEVAGFAFRAGLWGGVHVDGKFPQKKLLKKEISERFNLFHDEWIHNENSLDSLGRNIGYTPFSKYNYIIFSQDYNCEDSDTVTMHRVEVLHGEVQH